MTKVASLKQKVLVLQDEKSELIRLQDKSVDADTEEVFRHNFGSHLECAIKSVVERSNLRKVSLINKLIAEIVFNMREQGSESVNSNLVTLSKSTLKESLYPPWKVVRGIDMSGATLNLRGIEVLRNIEIGEKRFYRGSLLPCSAELKRCGATVEAIGKELFPFSIKRLDTGEEVLTFNYLGRQF